MNEQEILKMTKSAADLVARTAPVVGRAKAELLLRRVELAAQEWIAGVDRVQRRWADEMRRVLDELGEASEQE